MSRKIFVLILLILIISSCRGEKEKQIPSSIILQSSDFENGGYIPTKFTCDGEDISPELHWKNVPEKTKSLAIVCEDPDAPAKIWIHWVIFNIPADTTALYTGFSPTNKFLKIIRQGKNDFGNFGYNGPCPPEGTHRYYFRLYALDTFLDLKEGITKRELMHAMKGHIIDRGELMGLRSSE